jgi:hypothetical protein
MHFPPLTLLTTALALGFGTVLAAPAAPEVFLSTRQNTICSGLSANAQCCAMDVIGLANLDCGTRMSFSSFLSSHSISRTPLPSSFKMCADMVFDNSEQIPQRR